MSKSLSSLVNDFSEGCLCYKCLCCNENYQQKFDEKLQKRFLNTYKFSNHNKNKFILLLEKGVYPYECKGKIQ